MNVPLLALVGGFLGAGKTTLILRAARMLEREGMRVAAILNDQDAGLVDTRQAEAESIAAREVAGGCFCCRFSDLVEAAGQLRAYSPDVIFAEPVGSCIDLAATILQPLKELHPGDYRLAPLTVLADPELAGRIDRGEADPDVAYLFRNQLAEADIVCWSKRDLYPDPSALPVPVDFRLSARSGEGVRAWLSEVLEIRRVPGARTLDVDYQRYAAAEAALGWLNLQASVHLERAAGPAALVGPVLDEIDRALTGESIEIAHLKVFGQTASGYVKASICANGAEPEPDGDLLADAAFEHDLVINLRASGDPERLREIAMRVLEDVRGRIEVRHLGAFRPAPPRPEHRMA